MEDTSAHDLKKHVMEVFEEATKDCENKVLKEFLDSIRDYDSLNKYALLSYSNLANYDLTEEAKEHFKPRNELGILPDVAVFTIVIGVYANAGYGNPNMAEAALKVYHQMIATRVAPSSITYTLLIMALATHSSSDVNFCGYAKKYFLEMLEKGMKPNSYSLVSLNNAIACCDSVEKAREFCEQIRAKGFILQLNVPQIGNDSFAEEMSAMKMGNDVHSNTIDKDAQKVLRKWLRTDNLKIIFEMLGALMNDGNEEEASELYKCLFVTGMYPMNAMYVSFMQAQLKCGKTKGALDVYRAMLASGVVPNSYTYMVLIKGLTADPNFFEDAKKCLLEMMDKGLRPNAATYTAVIESFAKKEDKASEEECNKLVELMISKGLVPNAKAMMEVLKGRPKTVIRRIMNIVLYKLKG